MSHSAPRYSISIDTGGTFTDLVLATRDSVLALYKTPSNPVKLLVGIEHALALAADAQGLDVSTLLRQTETVVYSTTQATNAVIERRTAPTAFLTTDGHRDILVYREGGRDRPLDLSIPYPEPYVPRELTFSVRERVLSNGQIAEPLDDRQARSVLSEISASGVSAIGVCLLWSPKNPVHELRIGELLDAEFPHLAYTLSCQLNPVLREYQRASSTVIDASLKPIMGAHLAEVDTELRRLGFAGAPLMVTHTSGGLLQLHQMAAQPIQSIDSGPTLAPVAAAEHTRASDLGEYGDVLVVDAGGTTFDVSAVRHGDAATTREKWLGSRWYGHLTGMPAVDTRSIGAGGGSIAAVDPNGLLTVGPASAGADPGPACYGRGGGAPTVTDAALLAGLIDPANFLGGRIELQTDLARVVVERRVAAPLGLTVEDAANAIMTVYSEVLRSFLHEVLLSHGFDPRTTLLVAGGGSAGLNIASVAAELGIPRVSLPAMASGLSAMGGIYAELLGSATAGVDLSTAPFDREAAATAILSVRERLKRFHEALAVDADPDDVVERWLVEARYANQFWDLTVQTSSVDQLLEGELSSLVREFAQLHTALFGFAQADTPIEISSIRAELCVPRHKPAHPIRAGSVKHGVATTKRGPAVVTEPTTTIVVPADATLAATPTGYVIHCRGVA